MTAFGHEGSLGLHAGSRQQLVELLALTARHHIILLAVEDDDGRIVAVDIGRSAQTTILVRLLAQFRVEQHVLRRVLAHLHRLATVHVSQVNRTAPVAGCINLTALIKMLTDGAFQVDIDSTHLHVLHTTGCGSNRRQMTARRETACSNERRIELILGGLTAHKADDGTYIVDLCRPLGVHARTVIRADHCKTGIQQTLDDSTQIGSPLAVVAEPRTAVDVDYYGIRSLFLLRQINVASVIGLVIACIIYVFPLLRCLKFYLRHLESTESACGLSHSHSREAHH